MEELQKTYRDRIQVFASDLEKERLGLALREYEYLVEKVDSIIHSAAITKHYGEEEKFYAANVQATINLLELALLTKTKNFHHISTISVLHDSNDHKDYYTESDCVENLHENSTLYVKTKHQAEIVIEKYRERGLSINVYRVGNLAFILENFRTQENIEDNAFLNRIKCFLALNAIPDEISKVEISPVDHTAQAILKIFEKVELQNQRYHVFNPYICDLKRLFNQPKEISMHILSMKHFLDLILERLSKKDIHNELIMRFLLHQGWLEEQNKFHTPAIVMQNKTNSILEALGFKWPRITNDIFLSFLNKNCLY